MGPGIVIAVTWLGAGDLVDSAVSGGSYGYALMWALALALFVLASWGAWKALAEVSRAVLRDAA